MYTDIGMCFVKTPHKIGLWNSLLQMNINILISGECFIKCPLKWMAYWNNLIQMNMDLYRLIAGVHLENYS